MIAVRALLANPNPMSPANAEASKVYQEDKNSYERLVKESVDLSLEDKDFEELV